MEFNNVNANSNWNSTASVPPAPGAVGLNRNRSWNQRRMKNLRTRNWGQRDQQNGWSGFNNAKYLPQSLSSWEHQSVILKELRAQHGGSNRGVSFAPSVSSYSAPLSSYSTSTYSSTPMSSFLSAPVASPLASAPATIVPVNMLPPPINSGPKYEKIIGNKRGTRRYRKNLKQPLSNHAASPFHSATAAPLTQPRNMTPLGAGLLANGYGLNNGGLNNGSNTKLSRRQRKALRKQNSASHLTPLGTSATSGLNGISGAPLSGFAGAPLGTGLNNGSNAKLSRKQRKALKKQSRMSSAFSGPNVLPSGIPVNNAIPVTNVIGSPILSTAAPLSSNGLSNLNAAPLSNGFSNLNAAPLTTSTFTKTEQIIAPAPYAIGRSAF